MKNHFWVFGLLELQYDFFGRFIIGSLSVFWVLWKHRDIVLFNDFIFLFYSESEPFINVSKRAFKIIRVQESHRKLFMHPQTCLRIKLKPLAYKSTNSRICSQLIKMIYYLTAVNHENRYSSTFSCYYYPNGRLQFFLSLLVFLTPDPNTDLMSESGTGLRDTKSEKNAIKWIIDPKIKTFADNALILRPSEMFVSSSDLEKCSTASLSHQWILCSEWVPSEWESKQLIKTSQ